MPKLLNLKEAEEIANTLADEYGIPSVKIYWEIVSSYGAWAIYKKKLRTISFLKWTWEYRFQEKESWFDSSTLEDLIVTLERRLNELNNRVETAAKIRERHATRVLDKELTK